MSLSTYAALRTRRPGLTLPAYRSLQLAAALAAPTPLVRYWTVGEGAAKIRWGTDGDLTRCHRHLNDYMTSDQAWGFCNNLHKIIFGRPNDPND